MAKPKTSQSHSKFTKASEIEHIFCIKEIMTGTHNRGEQLFYLLIMKRYLIYHNKNVRISLQQEHHS